MAIDLGIVITAARPSTASKRPNSSNGNRPAKIPAGRANGAAARAPKEDKMDVDEQPLLQCSENKEARARKVATLADSCFEGCIIIVGCFF